MSSVTKSRILFAILVIISLVFLIVSIYMSVCYFSADTVTGEVTYFRPGKNNKEGIVEITYEYEGKTYTDGSRFPKKMDVEYGSIAEFRVNPNNPDKIMIFKDVYSWYIFAVIMIINTALFGVAVFGKNHERPYNI